MSIFSRFNAFLSHFFHKMGNYATNNEKTPIPTLFGEFRVVMPYLEEESLKKCLERLNNAEKPNFLLGKPVPNDFNGITFGAYSDLCDALGEKDHLKAMQKLIMAVYPNFSYGDIDRIAAYDVWGFASFAAKEVDRINKLFSAVRLEYSEQERKAGIDKLQFGVFGILDWYAKRMGIIDQNKVFSIKWVRIYQCMKNDTEEAAFNRRLQKVYENEAKSKHRK